MAGIKLHAPIDVVLSHNRIHHAGRGIWLDWMTQGTRITGNTCYSNTTDDLFVEVSHGPFLVDNNLLLSPQSLRDWSEGGAFVHNLILGRIESRPMKRSTPYHQAHSTAIVGLRDIKGGDHRFFNNLLVGAVGSPGNHARPYKVTVWGYLNDLVVGAARKPDDNGFGLWMYDTLKSPIQTGGNIYYNGAGRYASGNRSLPVNARPEGAHHRVGQQPVSPDQPWPGNRPGVHPTDHYPAARACQRNQTPVYPPRCPRYRRQ